MLMSDGMRQRVGRTAFGSRWKRDTVREYMIDCYVRLVYLRLVRDSQLHTTHCVRTALSFRSRLRAGETTIKAIGVRDERKKLSGKCVYCEQAANTVDHLIPRLAGGPDSADNLVAACSACNASKGGRDVYDWARRKGFFPLGVTRRYLVLAWRWCERAGLLDVPLDVLRAADPPFRTDGFLWEIGPVSGLQVTFDPH